MRERDCNQKEATSLSTPVHPGLSGPHADIECGSELQLCITSSHERESSKEEESKESGESSQLSRSIFDTTLAPAAPTSLCKGTATSFLCWSYFSPLGSSRVFVYSHKEERWSELPECPNTYFSLVTVNGLVTAVGGWVGGDRRRPTNSLLSLFISPSSQQDCPHDGNFKARSNAAMADIDSSTTLGGVDIDKESTSDSTSLSAVGWSEHFPPMPTRRGYPAAISHKHSLIVIGGDTTWLKDTFLTMVEVLDTATLQWSTVSSLPRPLRGATGAVCVNEGSKNSCSQLYLLGGWDKNGNTVFRCSLEDLLSTAVPSDPRQMFPDLTAPCSCCWGTVAPAPCWDSSCISIGDKLFTFGGKGRDGGGSKDIHMYCEETNDWRLVGSLSVGRSHPLVTSLADGRRALVAGGLTKGPHVTNCCEMVLLTAY